MNFYGFYGSNSNKQSSYSPMDRKMDMNTSQFSLAHEPETFKIKEKVARQMSISPREHIEASMKIPGFNS